MEVWAHRGAWRGETDLSGAPLVENTLAAFARGFALGADGMECDVHRTNDGALVIHHDAQAAEIGLLAAHDLAEIQAVRSDIPTLEATLEACAGFRCNIEIKNLPTDEDFDPEHRVAELVATALRAVDARDVIVSSFNLATLDAFRAAAPDIATGWLIGATMTAAHALDIAVAHGHTALHPNIECLDLDGWAHFMPSTRDAGIECNLWTVNALDAFEALAECGVDAVITDDVAGAMRTLHSR